MKDKIFNALRFLNWHFIWEKNNFKDELKYKIKEIVGNNLTLKLPEIFSNLYIDKEVAK